MATSPAPDRERPVIGFLTDFGLDGAAAICRGRDALDRARRPDRRHQPHRHEVRDPATAHTCWPARSRGCPWASTWPWWIRASARTAGRSRCSRRAATSSSARTTGCCSPAARRLGGVAEARTIENGAWRLPVTSSTFHGRDIFAPVAAHLAMGAPFADVGPEVDPADARRAPGRRGDRHRRPPRDRGRLRRFVRQPPPRGRRGGAVGRTRQRRAGHAPRVSRRRARRPGTAA